jgi:hypothetical protein
VTRANKERDQPPAKNGDTCRHGKRLFRFVDDSQDGLCHFRGDFLDSGLRKKLHNRGQSRSDKMQLRGV